MYTCIYSAIDIHVCAKNHKQLPNIGKLANRLIASTHILTIIHVNVLVLQAL